MNLRKSIKSLIWEVNCLEIVCLSTHGKLMIQITSGLIFRRQRESSFIMLRHIMENENCCSTIMKWQWRWPSSHEKRLMPPISLSKSSSFLRIRKRLRLSIKTKYMNIIG